MQGLERTGAWRALMVPVFMLVAALLAGCVPRPGEEALVPVPVSVPEPVSVPGPGAESGAAGPQARIVRLYVATTRRPDPAPSADFGDQPDGRMHYLRYDISVPPAPGRRRFWATGRPDPRHDFLIREVRVLSRAAFLAGVARDNGSNPRAEVPVFVHGYNIRYAEAVLRFAKLAAEAGDAGRAGGFAAPVLFSWPSEGRFTGYLADREEAQLSRDAFAGLLADLSRARGHVLLAAHSLGAWLSMESLRSLALSGARDVLDDLEIVLVAPDIDVLVFQAQLRAVQPLNRPIAVLVARDDKALKLSARLSTRRPRLGQVDVHDPRAGRIARAEDVQLIDISSVKPTSFVRHSRFLNMAGAWHEMEAGQQGFDAFRDGGAFVLNRLGTGLIQVGAALSE